MSRVWQLFGRPWGYLTLTVVWLGGCAEIDPVSGDYVFDYLGDVDAIDDDVAHCDAVDGLEPPDVARAVLEYINERDSRTIEVQFGTHAVWILDQEHQRSGRRFTLEAQYAECRAEDPITGGCADPSPCMYGQSVGRLQGVESFAYDTEFEMWPNPSGGGCTDMPNDSCRVDAPFFADYLGTLSD